MITASYETLDEPPIPEWIVRVTVVGGEFVRGALKPCGKVGDVPIEGLLLDDDATGFVGYLAIMPQDGDHLFLGYDPSVLADTGIEFHTTPDV